MKKLLLLPLILLICAATSAISFNYEELQTEQLKDKVLSLSPSCASTVQGTERPTKKEKMACDENHKMATIF